MCCVQEECLHPDNHSNISGPFIWYGLTNQQYRQSKRIHYKGRKGNDIHSRWSLRMDEYFHPTFYWACDNISMLGLKFIQGIEWTPRGNGRSGSALEGTVLDRLLNLSVRNKKAELCNEYLFRLKDFDMQSSSKSWSINRTFPQRLSNLDEPFRC